MAKQQYPLHVEMEDSTEWDVTGDQRDVARWEIQSFGGPVSEAATKWNTFGRFVAWSASVRVGKTDLTWNAFDSQCIEVGDVDSEVADDAEDPGPAAASGTP